MVAVLAAILAGAGLGIVYVLQHSGGPVGPTPRPSSAAAVELADRLPAAVAPDCVIADSEPPARARADCTAEDGHVEIAYTLYQSQADMQAAYDAQASAAGVAARTGNCSLATSWPSEGTYFPRSGEVRGRLMCALIDDVPTAVWSDDKFNILGELRAPDGDEAQVFAIWATKARLP
jgi:hypothetical protein